MTTTETRTIPTGATADAAAAPAPYRPVIDPGFGLVAVDLYRDIHKGIRAELFAITMTAGSLDPTDRGDRRALADHVTSVAGVLESHAHHEDAFIDPVLEEHFPALAEQVRGDHDALERRFSRIVDLAGALVHVDAGDERRLAHLVQLELAGFTSAYLVHQDLEERDIMPRLERRLGVEATMALHGSIVGSIPPDELARSLAFMLPAMNVLDRAEMLVGIRAAAPAAAFEAIFGLARSVLCPADFAALSHRLEVA